MMSHITQSASVAMPPLLVPTSLLVLLNFGTILVFMAEIGLLVILLFPKCEAILHGINLM
jgi:hypothetical protein